MASFYIPLSGLNADSKALNTIANNLSNMNTTAFKAQKTNFSDLFYQQIGTTGSGNAIQVGGGVNVASNVVDFSQGSFNTNGTSSSDVALNGNGFLVVNGGGTNLLTRNGAFTQSKNGNLVTDDGLAVMGYPAVNGVVNTNAALSPISIPVIGQIQQPRATTTFGMNATLDSSAAVGTSVPGQVQVYDSLGNSYEATVTYTKTGTNAWSYSVSLPDTLSANSNNVLGTTTINYTFGSSGAQTATVNPGTNLTITGPTATGTATITAPTVTANPPETVAQYVTDLNAALTAAQIVGVNVSSVGGKLSIVGANISTSGSVIQDPVASANANGSLSFDSSGNLVSPAANVSGISFAGLSDGAAVMKLTWDILGSGNTPTISQVDATSSTSASTQNGYASGAYQGFAIGSDGTVTASYSNGQTQAIGQLALANVTNLQGLALQGNGNYATTLASGAASIGISGTNGLATIQGSSLEQSNVNISAEFSNLIIAQRAFEANSKAITTFDTVTQDTINMVH
ncbi:MAG TPA: flagellar hook protein FlgE [Terracidiphilus sp.]|nr:flagellar hook protein FlgE [Terracidiphilus sp.]